MHYILTPKEMQWVIEGRSRDLEKLQDRMNKLCKMSANKIPVFRQGMLEGQEPKPWGCIYNTQAKPKPVEGFCDDCPVQKYCTMEKKYSDEIKRKHLAEGVDNRMEK